MSQRDDFEFYESSANVFADLGVDQPDEALVKAELARQISAIVADRGLSQSDAAPILGVDQSKISALVRGRLAGYSIERLLRFLTELDRDIEIVVKPKAQAQTHGRVRVVAD
jgi:predicted XRE-type DNA-binding protein